MGLRDDLARRRVGAWLASSGETQTAFGERIGRNQAWMSRYLDAEFDADLDTLEAIAKALHLSLFQLLDVDSTNADESELMTRFRALTPDARALLLNLLRLWRAPSRRRRAK